MDRVFAGGIAPSMASAVAGRALIELLARDGLVDASDILNGREDADRHSWADVILNAIDNRAPDPNVWIDANVEPLFSLFGSGSSFLEGPANLATILERRDVQYVVSSLFSRRVVEWFVGLAAHDLESALRGDVPTPGLFDALPGRELRQIGGLWVWERFTLTEPEHWTESSLIQEWQWSRGGATDICDRRTMSERTISSDEVAAAAIQAISDHDETVRGSELFSPRNYVQAASNHLSVGEWDKASKIFQGIVDLRPGDGEAWNNLGFCELGQSAVTALPMLRRAAALQRPVPLICTANQVLALHLSGRDAEAVELSKGASVDNQDSDVPAMVWFHPVDGAELELGHVDNPLDYLNELRAHILEGECQSRGDDLKEIASA
jgi:hypothetical protein